MGRFGIVLTAVLSTLVLVSCSKRFVGNPAGFAGYPWCHYSEDIDNGVKRCIIQSEWTEFDFEIRKGEVAGEYWIEGTMDLTRDVVKSAGSELDMQKSRFSMLVASEGVIVDNVSFRPAYRGDIREKMPFRIRYLRKEGFNLITFDSYVQIRGYSWHKPIHSVPVNTIGSGRCSKSGKGKTVLRRHLKWHGIALTS